MSRQRLLSTGQAAKLVNVTSDTVLKWIKKGRLQASRTAGGHFRIDRDDLMRVVGEVSSARSSRSEEEARACWEYHAVDGVLRPQCRECLVYRARALHCYELSRLPRDYGFAGLFCDSSCEECSFYREVAGRKMRILVVSDSVQMRRQMEADRASREVELAFAAGVYECSSLVETLRPDCVAIDARIGVERWRELAVSLRQDPRIPGVDVVVLDPDRSCHDEPGLIVDGVRFSPTTSLVALRTLLSLVDQRASAEGPRAPGEAGIRSEDNGAGH